VSSKDASVSAGSRTDGEKNRSGTTCLAQIHANALGLDTLQRSLWCIGASGCQSKLYEPP
jgi:hypothetical protein